MTDRELMQQALDALSMAVEPKKGKVYAFEFQPIDCVAMHFKAIEALRARLEEPEPYAAQAAMVAQQTQGRMYVDPVTGDVGIGTVKWDASAPLVMHPHPAFQATQPQPDLAKVGEVGVWGERQWQGLTDEEVIKLGGLDKDSDYFGLWYDFARAIEAKLKEKNT